MADDWFRAEITTGGRDNLERLPSYQEDYDYSYVGIVDTTDTSPSKEFMIIRAWAEQSTLDTAASLNQVERYNGVPVAKLNEITGQNRTSDGWNAVFNIA